MSMVASLPRRIGKGKTDGGATDEVLAKHLPLAEQPPQEMLPAANSVPLTLKLFGSAMLLVLESTRPPIEPFDPDVFDTPSFAQASPAIVQVPVIVMLPWARTLPAKF